MSRRRLLHTLNWVLVGLPVALVALGLFVPFSPPGPFVRGATTANPHYAGMLFRVLSTAIGISAVVAVLAWVYAAICRRWLLLVAGLFAGVAFVILGMVLAIFSVYPGVLASVHGSRRGEYFALVRRPPGSDVIYRILSAPTPDSAVWQIRFGGTELDYSEDGSLTSDPQLLLSEDEDVLVVKRGGYYVDAVHLPSGSMLSEHVAWDEPDREDLWRRRDARIGELLESHRIAARTKPDDHEHEVLRTRYANEIASAMCAAMNERVLTFAAERKQAINCASDAEIPTAKPAKCIVNKSQIVCEVEAEAAIVCKTPGMGNVEGASSTQFHIPLRHDLPAAELVPPNERIPLRFRDNVYQLNASLRLDDGWKTLPVDWTVSGVIDGDSFLILSTHPPGSSWSTETSGTFSKTQDPVLVDLLKQAFPYRAGDRLPLPKGGWKDAMAALMPR